MAQQTWSLPPPVTSGLSFQQMTSPFLVSIPIELRNIPVSKNADPVPATSEKDRRERAWKYEGYREFSKWMASDDDFFVIRRFQSLNANVILYMQDRITQIEERLAQIHKENENGGNTRRNSSFRWDMKNEQERDRLMAELTGLLHHYNQYIETFSKIRERPKADQRQVRNLKTFAQRGAVKDTEMGFVNHKGDLMSMNPHSTTPLGRMLEATRLIRLSSLMRAKRDPNFHSSSEYTHYASDTALANLSTGSIIILGLCMLLGPMWWLEFVSNSKTRLLIITIFLTFFILLMSLATVNRPFEVVASSAAYAAVLMVFMQIDGKK